MDVFQFALGRLDLFTDERSGLKRLIKALAAFGKAILEHDLRISAARTVI
jgi:hypothetical protein